MEEGLKRLLVMHCAFGSMGESKKTRMPHLQGFVQLKIKSRMETVKAKLSIGRAHLEKRRGTPQEARDYCKKEEDFEEGGILQAVGRSAGLQVAVDDKQNNAE